MVIAYPVTQSAGDTVAGDTVVSYDDRSQSTLHDWHTPRADTRKITKWVLFLFLKNDGVGGGQVI